MHSHLTATEPPRTAPVQPEPARRSAIGRVVRHPIVVHITVLLGFIGVGIAVTWPHATYLAGKLPYTRDAGSYVWGFWWMAHAILHLQDPWVTSYIAAPVGTQLGLHALMPLAGAVMLPVTLLWGPSASYTLLSIMLPGLMGYAMYRVARLWLPSQIGAIAAGAFFGFSTMIDYQTWVHLNLAAGALFLPITLEAAVRLRRRPGPGQAIVLGIVLGASMLVDQQSAILCLILAIGALLPWALPYLAKPKTAPTGATAEPPAIPAEPSKLRRALRRGLAFAHVRLRHPSSPASSPVKADAQPSEVDLADDEDTLPIPRHKDQPAPRTPPWKRLTTLEWKRLPAGLARFASRAARSAIRQVVRLRVHWRRWLVLILAGVVAFVVALPQLIAIKHAWVAAAVPANLSAPSYIQGIRLPDMFMPSPRVTMFGISIPHAQNYGTFGAVGELLALIGLALAWRRRNAWLLAAFFVGVAALAVGADILLKSGPVTPAPEMYNGVLVSKVLPFTWFVQIPGLSGFREPSRIAELGVIPIALLAGYTVNWIRYHARLLVIPVLALAVFEFGLAVPPGASKTMATSYPALDQPIAADHSGSIVLDVPFGLRGGTGVTGLAFVPQAQVLATADQHPLADALLSRIPITTSNAIFAEPFYRDLISTQTGKSFSPAQLLAAAKNAADMHIGWILLWEWNKHMRDFLAATGYNFAYRVDGASVWRPDGLANGVPASP